MYPHFQKCLLQPLLLAVISYLLTSGHKLSSLSEDFV